MFVLKLKMCVYYNENFFNDRLDGLVWGFDIVF